MLVICHQRLALYADLTVFENLRFQAEIFGLRDSRAAVETAIQEFELAYYARTRAEELSGGWMRKLQLTAALIHSPMLIFLDEPTAGLDALSCHDAWRRIERLAASGAAVIVSSHDLGEVERCSRLAILSEGQLLASGTPDQIIQSPSAIVFLFSGLEARALQQSMERTGGVIATYPQGESLRVVGIPGLAETLADAANSKRLKISQVPMRLEDAVLTFLHNRDGNHKAFS
jgi:ABC-2 type transport system ATP-binding protein